MWFKKKNATSTAPPAAAQPAPIQPNTPMAIQTILLANAYRATQHLIPAIDDATYAKHLHDIPAHTTSDGPYVILPRPVIDLLLQVIDAKDRLKRELTQTVKKTITTMGVRAFERGTPDTTAKLLSPNIPEDLKYMMTVTDVSEKIFWYCCRLLLIEYKITNTFANATAIRTVGNDFVCIITTEDETEQLPAEVIQKITALFQV